MLLVRTNAIDAGVTAVPNPQPVLAAVAVAVRGGARLL
eukprot:SAG31_NODE_13108_length_892_cov_0.977301_2_plen_37_part_01